MKTIGEILTTARKQKGLSVAEVAKITKIDPKYINALEKNDFTLLPAATFTKGFIRNYAKVVGKSGDEMVAIFRRDYSHKTPKPKTTLTSSTSGQPPIKHFLGGWGNLALLLFGVAVFLGYLGFQYRALIVRPPLEVVSPTVSGVLVSPVLIEGKTSPDSLVTIDESTEVRPDSSGVFSSSMTLSPGDYTLLISAVNRFGRKSTVEVPITVISGK